MPELRRVPDEDVADFRQMVGYAFMPEEAPPDPGDDDISPPMEVGTRYGRYDGDDLRAVCKLIDFTTRVRDAWHPNAGVSFVASPPESRRQGHVAAMLRDALAECRETGTYLSTLYPFKRTFYEQYGWATAARGVTHTVDPDLLSFTRDHRHGEFVPLEADDWERLDTVYDAHSEPRNLALDRSEEWWRKRVFRGWRKDPYAYGWERDGDLEAYLVYRVDSDDDGKTLSVGEWAYTDHDARLALLRFLADHDSQVDEVKVKTAPDADLLDVVPNADDLDADLDVGGMLRLVDVPEALEALSYPVDVTADLRVEVRDAFADWNDDTYRVAVADGTATVDRASESEPPDVSLDVGTLAQLYVGYRDASELARVGDVEADSQTVDTLAALFPAQPTYLREGF